MGKRLCWQLLAISTGWPCVRPSDVQQNSEVRRCSATPGGDWLKPWQTLTSLGSVHRWCLHFLWCFQFLIMKQYPVLLAIALSFTVKGY